LTATVKRCRAWLELLRLPNLPTVPGEPLAGFALAALGQETVAWSGALPAAGAALLLYMAGLIWNDCADRREDRIHRPCRPIPSGRVGLRSAAAAAALLGAGGVGLAALSGPGTCRLSVLLAGLILVYDFGPRRIRWLGALNMGACRGVSLLMGASVALPPRDWPAAVLVASTGVFLFIAAVTWIAARETDSIRIGAVRWAPASIVVLTVVLLWGVKAAATVPTMLCAGLAIAWLLLWGARLRGCPAPHVVGKSIGGMIRALAPLQAALCAAGAQGGDAVAVVLLLAWPVSSWLARRFYAS